MSAKKLDPDLQAILSAGDAGYHATRVELLQRYLAEHPQAVRGWIDLGQSLSELFRFDEAEQALNRALELVPPENAAGILGLLGHLCLDRGQLAQAAEFYRQQIERDPEESSGHLFLANILLRQGDASAAITTLQQALACPRGCREEVHFQLGVALRSLDQLEDARLQLEQALRLDPEMLPAQVALKDLKSALARRR